MSEVSKSGYDNQGIRPGEVCCPVLQFRYKNGLINMYVFVAGVVIHKLEEDF